MAENEIDTEVAKSDKVEADVESADTALPEQEESTQELRARLQRAETKLERMKLEAKVEKKVEKVLEEQASELDNAAYALLAAKGIEDDDEVSLARSAMLKWKMPLREVLRDEDFKSKLTNLRSKKDIENATPGSSKRGGVQQDNFEYALAEFEQTGKLPKNFELRKRVVNARYEKETGNKPTWR